MVYQNCNTRTVSDCPELKLGSFNVNGLGDKVKRGEVFKWLNNKNDDIILLQETHSTPDSEQVWERDWGHGKIVFNHGSSNATGVAFLIKNKSLEIKCHKVIVPGRASILEFMYGGCVLSVVNIYAPNNDDTNFLETVFSETLGREGSDLLLWGGDWNTVLDNDKDKLGGNWQHSNKKCQSLLNNIISECGIHDAFRLTNSDKQLYTHYNKRCKTATRLDFFLVDASLINFPLCTSSISHGFSSDHSYVSLIIQGSTITRGRGYWKLNNMHLKQDEYCKEVRNIIAQTQAESWDSVGGLWDVIKFKVKDYSIRYSKKYKKVKNDLKIELETKIEELKNSIAENKNKADALDILHPQLHSLQDQLNNILREEVQGAIIRSRAQWVEEGERSTKYFLGLEKSNQKRKSLTKLITESKTILTSQNDISNHVVSFYQKLFTSSNPRHKNVSDYVASSDLQQISPELSAELDCPLDEAELDSIVKNLSPNKTPGMDGLSSEFYKTFWDVLKPLLIQVYNAAIESHTLTPSMRIGIVSLIPKPKSVQELNYIKNWRPITLLNNDYKILTHVIKNRILKAVPHIISNVQSGFQAGRSTSDNLILMYLVMEHFQNHPEDEGLLLQVDFEKAFDSVEHVFLFETLESMGFGKYLIDLVKLVFHGCMSYANVNGHLSSPIYLGRGLHQGSPLSPVLFLIVAQVFTNKINNNTDIKGIEINAVQLLLSMFADDTDMFLAANPGTVDAIFLELTKFGAVAGCNYNASKTRCIPLGKAKHNTTLKTYLSGKYGKELIPDRESTFPALGIIFNSNDIPSTVHSNYISKLEKATSLANVWNKRDLTVYGRITLIKSFLLSQFVYLAIPLPRPSTAVIKQVNSLIYKFMWGGGREKIKREIVNLSREQGGLGMIDFNSFISSLKIKLLQKIMNENFHHAWKSIIVNQLAYPLHITISIEAAGAKSEVYRFTTDLLHGFTEWKSEVAMASDCTINHCVWGNKAITDVGSRFWNDQLINRDILYLSQFLDNHDRILSYNQFKRRYNINSNIISSNDYVAIKLGIRRFDHPTRNTHSVAMIREDLCLKVVTNTTGQHNTSQPSKTFRDLMCKPPGLTSHTKLDAWKVDFESSGLSVQKGEPINFDWNDILFNLYNTTNNYKLIQHQYKVFMKIATSKHLRHKMKIEHSPCCHICIGVCESLSHIYLECPKTLAFLEQIEELIRARIDNSYSDHTKFFHFTCNHPNKAINFINLVCNWYIGRQFQSNKPFYLDAFDKFLKLFLVGEKLSIKNSLT